jgi:cystathionine beta-lyase family protein involved in aluminum resistance
LKTNQEIESALRNYHWLIKEVVRLKYDLGLIGNPLSNKGEIGPKTGRPFNPTLNEVIRREHKQETLAKFESKINYVERNMEIITNDRELTVLNCLLDGMNINNISRHMGYSKRTIYSIKESIIEKMKNYAKEG